ncbi:MAG: hypothetical protein ABI626_00800 [Sphingomicrobium sp.]
MDIILLLFPCALRYRSSSAFPTSGKGAQLAMAAQVLFGDGGNDQRPWRDLSSAIVAADLETKLFMRGLAVALGLSAPSWAIIAYVAML